MPLSRFSTIFDVLACCCAVLLLAGCVSSVDPAAIDYRSQESQTSTALWIPPDMAGPVSSSDMGNTVVAPSSDQRSTTWSAYQRKAHVSSGAALTTPKNDQNAQPSSAIYLKRKGAQYWLVVKGQSPEKLLPHIQKFWLEQGFELENTKQSHALDNMPRAESEVIETQWRNMPASVNTGFIRSNISKIFNTAYVTRQKNKYRTRLQADASTPSAKYTEPTALGASSTLIFISQIALQEVRTGPTKEISQWKPAPSDPFAQSLYLQRLMKTLREQESLPTQTVAEKTVETGTLVSEDSALRGVKSDDASQKIGHSKKAVKAASATEQDPSLFILDQSFDRAWFEIGMALEQLNFTVEDLDRTKGLYYVRYVDPHDQSIAHQGFWSQLFHGRKEKKARPYALNVRAIQDERTQIAVLTSTGAVDHSLQAKRIIRLLDSAVRSQP